MTCLITGGRGFVGYWLVQQLKDKYKVLISSREDTPDTIHLDLLNYKKICNIIEQYKIKKIFHLAAQPSVHISFEKPFDTIQYNVMSSLNVIRACQKFGTKLIFASTSEIYKSSSEQLTENSLIEPRSPYTISKLTVDYLIPLLPVKYVILRLFNQTGPRQSTNFVISSFAKQLAGIKLGKIDNTIKVGNLNVMRDFLDVRDAVRAYDLVSDDENEIYNICSGQLYKISDLLNKLIELANIKVNVEVDATRLRKFDVMKYYGSYDKINKKLGWKPEIPIEKTLSDLFEYWLQNYSQTEIV